MKFALPILVLSLLANSALATEYQATAIYCGGPIESGDVSNCPSYSAWQGVSLKGLKSIILPTHPEDALIQLEDAAGNTWTQQLDACKAKLSDLRGCNIAVDLSNPEQRSIRIAIWDIGKPQRNLTLFIDGQNQLSVHSDDGDYLVFSLTEK